MSINIINGKNILDIVREKIKIKINKIKFYRKPNIAVINLGNNNASKIYIYEKKRLCNYVGIKFSLYNLKYNITEKYCISLIKKLNEDNNVDGILIQLPLPKLINIKSISKKIKIKKDIDGFHPYNFGKLAMGYKSIIPCTCLSVIKILKTLKKSLNSLCIVVIGSSNIVGKPIALELMKMNATVIICNKYTKNIKHYMQIADIIIIGIGKPNFISNKWIKKNTIIIDIGINRIDNGKVVGDFFIYKNFNIPSFITSVPGGIGPLTISSLLQNSFNAFIENK